MARRPFGGATTDLVAGNQGGLLAVTAATVTFWTAQSDGIRIIDLQNNGGGAVTSITCDDNGQLPTFQGPADGTAVMWADAGGPFRRMVFASDVATRLALLEAGGSLLDLVQPSGRDGFTITGNADPVISNLQLFKDSGLAPIGGVQNAGGDWMNDRRRTVWDYNGTEYWNVNIYGDEKLGYLNRAAVNGVPGNQLAFTTACFCRFEADRAPTVSDWTPYTPCTIAGRWSGGPKGIGGPSGETGMPPSPDGYNWAARLTATANNPVAATSPGGVYGVPVTPGTPRSAIAYFHAPVTPRTCRVILKYFDSSFTYLPASDQQATCTSSTSTWTRAMYNGTVPASAAWLVTTIQADTTTNGEQHDVAAVGTWASTQTAWNRPMVNQLLDDGGLGARKGDRVSRRDGNTGNWEYVCTTGGYPNQQVWAGIA